MATIVKRGDYQWQAKIRKKGHKSLSKTFCYRADAETWAREIEAEMDKGIYVSRTEAETTTLSDAIDRYIDEYIIPRLAHTSPEIYRIRALQKRDWGNRFLATFRGKDIADYIKTREREGKSANTIRLELALISNLFEVAASDWGMESLRNPVKKARKPKLPSGRKRRLEGDEEERLLKACSPKFRPVVLFALETAMRRGEISSLRWENVNLKKRSVFLPETKNSESRSVPLSPAAVNILKTIPRQISGTVFGMSTDAITRNMMRARKKAKIEDLKFHDLRHEAISRMFENTDLDAMEIKTITGHKTLAMLTRYSHLRTHRLADRLAGVSRG